MRARPRPPGRQKGGLCLTPQQLGGGSRGLTASLCRGPYLFHARTQPVVTRRGARARAAVIHPAEHEPRPGSPWECSPAPPLPGRTPWFSHSRFSPGECPLLVRPPNPCLRLRFVESWPETGSQCCSRVGGPGPAASASQGHLLEMCILGSHRLNQNSGGHSHPYLTEAARTSDTGQAPEYCWSQTAKLPHGWRV